MELCGLFQGRRSRFIYPAKVSRIPGGCLSEVGFCVMRAKRVKLQQERNEFNSAISLPFLPEVSRRESGGLPGENVIFFQPGCLGTRV